ncbi:hypothetical protein BAE44_0004670 [Dichanthelium oligosanthes]|uniref:Uncharacterized protein n=1 Tax=Dichanthelium oligosanthes TaxID=888268 RepID=A0A1E5WA84_9POAL|nr:hypothetical protein BAE44_0004670 [Dichanthelium oligosanthes]
MVSKKVPEITNRRCRQLHIATIKVANAFLLCSLACAAFLAAFVVLNLSIFAAFAPLIIICIIFFLLMVLTLGGIMTVLGGWLAEKDHARWGAMDIFMIVLTSAFVSSFGFMVLAAAPSSARERLAPVARVLIWSTVALLLFTAWRCQVMMTT